MQNYLTLPGKNLQGFAMPVISDWRGYERLTLMLRNLRVVRNLPTIIENSKGVNRYSL